MKYANFLARTAAILLLVCVGAWFGGTTATSAKTMPRSGGAATMHASTILDEFNGSTLGVANGITFAPAIDGEGAVFRRAAGSYIQYPRGIPRQGTLEWWIKVDSGYSYHNFALSAGQTRALIFTTDIAGGDVTWPGSAWLWVSANGDITFSLATIKYGKRPPQMAIARGTPFRFGEWHSIGISYGSEGQAIMVDGRLVASEPGNTQWMGSGGNHFEPVDLPTIGESVSGFWRPHQYSGGFNGIVDRFRASTAQRDWVLSAVNPTARTSGKHAATSACTSATDLGYSLSADGRTYRVEALTDLGGKPIPIFVDEQGRFVRNAALLKRLELGAWMRKNVIASSSTRAELAQKDRILSNAVETLQALTRYQAIQDLVAREAVAAIEAAATGGTSLPAGLAQLSVGELEHQLEQSPRTVLTAIAEEGLVKSRLMYDKLAKLLYPASAQVLEVDRLQQSYTLLMRAHALEQPSEALAVALSPEHASELTKQALESVVSQVIPKLGNPTAVVTLDVLLKTQQGLADAAATMPVLKGYRTYLNLALNLNRAYQRQISTWATEAANAAPLCTSSSASLPGKVGKLYPFCRAARKCGYIDSAGRMVVPPIYLKVRAFSEGFGGVQFANGKYGFVNSRGSVVIPARFANVGDFHEGLAHASLVRRAWGFAETGFIDHTGTYVIAPTIGLGPAALPWAVDDFSDGLAYISELNGRSGWLDKTGKLALREPTEYRGDWIGVSGGKFSDNLTVLGFDPKRGPGEDLLGYMNEAGQIVIGPRFTYADPFSEGLAAVALGKPPNWKYGYIDTTGQVVIGPKFGWAGKFSEGLAPVAISGKTGFINKTGAFVISPKYASASAFSGGLASVRMGNRCGYTDKLGRMRISLQFKYCFAFSGDLAIVQFDSGYGYVNKEGKVIARSSVFP